ncbi:MAG: DUF58 domain-containing protein [Anaerolineales bacterium]|nr:DUF58 domain-containing protein [Anaerolineales bacterium]
MKQRAGTLVLLTIASFVGALLSKRPRSRDILFNIGYLLSLLLFISFLWTWINIRTIRLIRTTRARRAQVGRTMEERFSVQNSSPIPKLWLEITDKSDLPGHMASHVIKSMRSKGRYQWRVNTLCMKRGQYTLGPISLTTGDPFGLFTRQREIPATTQVVIYPMTIDIPIFALPVGILPGGDALRQRTHYVTPNAAGVREYAPGDSFNRIHWPSSARRDRLIVKEFELDPLADIWIFPDLHKSVQASDKNVEEFDSNYFQQFLWQPDFKFELTPNTEEYVVTIAASLAQYFLRKNRAVGMITYAQEREVIQADRGERQLNKILERLAIVRALGEIPINHVIFAELDQIPRGTTTILITPAATLPIVSMIQRLERRGVRVIVVLIDPSGFGGRHSATSIAAMIRMSGTPTYVVNRGDSLEHVFRSIR